MTPGFDRGYVPDAQLSVSWYSVSEPTALRRALLCAALVCISLWMGSRRQAPAMGDGVRPLPPLADHRPVSQARLRLELPRVASDGTTRMVFQPEFRSAVDLLEDARSFKLKDTRIELITPRVVQRPELAPGAKGREGLHRLLISAISREYAHAAFDALRALDAPTRMVQLSLLICEVWHHKRKGSGGSLLFDRDTVNGQNGTIFRGVGMSFEPNDYLRSTLAGARPFEGTSLNFAEGNAEGGAFEYVARALQKEGDARFLAWPTLKCTEGKPAKIESLRYIPQMLLSTGSANQDAVSVSEELGLKLRVLPVRIGSDSSTIEIDLWMRVPQEDEGSNTSMGTLRIRERQIRTRVTVPDGLAAVFGGVKIRGRSRERRGMPGLSALSPVDALLSARAKGTEYVELCFVLRATIITPSRDHLPRATQPTVRPVVLDDPCAVPPPAYGGGE